MLQQRKASTVRVSRHRSLDNKHKDSPVKNNRRNTIIHVNIELPKTIHSAENNLHSILNKERKTSITVNQVPRHSVTVTKIHRQHCSLSQSNPNTIQSGNLSKKSSPQTSAFTKTSCLSRSSRVTHHEQNKNNWSDEKGMTTDYHQKSKRNKKNKCSRRCLIISLLITLFVLLNPRRKEK